VRDGSARPTVRTVPDEPMISRSLFLHAPLRRKPHDVLTRLLDRLPADTPADGPNGPVAQLEARISRLLGKEAALFFPSGTMAQQVALRVHAERRGRTAFAAHPQSHLAVGEEHGYSVVHGLRFQAVGDRHEPMTLSSLRQVGEPLAAVLWELPQRDIGGELPTWEELEEQVDWAGQRGAAVHLDGARLWEAQTYYERPFAEIAGLFDSVYVSLYKGLEGVRGAVLAADAETIAAASVWLTRLGGAISEAWPLAAVALLGLDDVLPRMAEFRDHAVALATAINADGVASTVPNPPKTPLFHVHLPAPKAAVEQAGAELIAERGIQLFGRVRSSPDNRRCSFEVVVGENAMDFTPEEVVELIGELVKRALG
jgi:threonine aldolase